MPRKKKSELKTINFSELSANGVEIQPIESPKKLDDYLLRLEGYRRVPLSAAAKASAVFQFLPQNAAMLAQQAAADNTIKAVTEGCYKVVLRDSLHLAKSKNMAGAYRGTLLSNETNQIAGQAEFLAIDPVKVSAAPRIAAGIFSVMSVVTSQYYLSEINRNIEHLDKKIEDVKSILLDEKKAQIWANDQTLNHIYRNINVIMNNPLERSTVMTQILMIKNKSLSDLCFFDIQINRKVNSVNSKSSKDDLKTAVEEITDYLPEYWRSVLLFEKATMLEMIIAEMDDPEYISSIKSAITEYKDKYIKTLNECKNRLSEVFRISHALNFNEWSTIFTVATTTATVLLPGKVLKTVVATGAGSVLAVTEHKKALTKEALTTQMESYLKICGNVKPFDEIINSIQQYQSLMNSPLEFIKAGDDVYLKCITA